MSNEKPELQSWTIKEINFSKEDDTLFEIKCVLDEDSKTVATFSQDEWYYSNVAKDQEDHSLPKVGDKLVFASVDEKEIEEEKKIYNL